ncbi:MAG: recombinase family protein [Mediterraneibacter gnavus]
MSYFIYARKSRKDAELEALGIDVLERHITTLLELAKTLSLPIGAIYREVVSGDSIDTRPVMTQVLSEVEACMWDGALVMDVDRLARGDTIDQGRVQRAFFLFQHPDCNTK